MASIGMSVADIARRQRRWYEVVGVLAKKSPPHTAAAAADTGRLRETTGFGPNPGQLRMLSYAPENLPPASALVVVLHGCTQTAAGYDAGTGWTALAERSGFAVLCPEQRKQNNPKTCFNWFVPGDVTRGGGEAASICQMVVHAVAEHGIDPRRVFVTGLSAGGAMTGAMLATYPEVFAAGAIVAGLPFGAATDMPSAFESMFQGRSKPAAEWGNLVRAASPHRGPWPRVSVWHGSADTTVKPMNAVETIKQWTDVHGLPSAPSTQDVVDGYPRAVWRDRAGADVIESYTITGMAHGTPIAPKRGDDGIGQVAPFILDVGIASTVRIAAFFGLAGAKASKSTPDRETVLSGDVLPPLPARARAAEERPASAPAAAQESERSAAPPPREAAGTIESIINTALRKAGLM